MGLISKIEDKLHSDKGQSQSDNSKLQKSSYEDQSSSSHLRHPVQSGQTTGTYGSSTTDEGAYGSSTSGAQGYGSSSGERGYGDSRTTDVGRDGYGGSSSGYGSSDRTDPSDTTSSGAMGSGPREPYDPYSSKGQATAANAATGYPGGSSGRDYGSSTYANDPNVPRSREGGVMNPSEGMSSSDPYSSSTRHQDPYTTSTTNSSGHPIRDAAMVGGAGAAGAGAGAYGHHSSSNPQDVSYMNRSSGDNMGSAAPMGSSGQPGVMSGAGSGMGGASTAPSVDPKKMGGAYEAGYRDAMEHAKEQMGLK